MTTLKQKLQCKHTTIGSWITLGHPAIGEIMARAGFDWVVVDLEHSTIDICEAGNLIRAIDSLNVPCLVRVTSNNPDQIKRILDAGASGIIVPSINSRASAVEAVSSTQYAPYGKRGVGLGRAQEYGPGFKEYFDKKSRDIVVIVMIEDKVALPEINSILSTPGVDGYLIGPYDLSCSLGIPGEFDNPLFIQTLSDIKQSGELVGCPSGIHLVEPNLKELNNKIKEGYKFIAYGVDIRMLDVACREAVRVIKATK
jgi:2-dehydro-3-deoxyglucarate aldolase